MTETMVAGDEAPEDLASRLRRLRAQQPNLRVRDAAALLGVSEAELVAARCGTGATRLDGRWASLIEALPDLGTVMVLTRNDHAVHEKVGRFGNISISGNGGVVLNGDIDLRLFLRHWHSGFAVTDESPNRTLRSLQFFTADGTAIHKVYLRDGSDRDAYEALVGAYRNEDQSPGLRMPPRAEAPAGRPDDAIDGAALRERWRALEDVHDFFGMLQDLGAGRVQALRLAGDDLALRVPCDSFVAALEAAAAAELPVMIFVGSAGVVQIHTGPVRTLKAVGPWFNVLDPGFNLHLRPDGIESAWIVRKPTRDGVVTSLEIFDADERQIAWMFGERKRGHPEREDWRRLVGTLEARGG